MSGFRGFLGFLPFAEPVDFDLSYTLDELEGVGNVVGKVLLPNQVGRLNCYEESMGEKLRMLILEHEGGPQRKWVVFGCEVQSIPEVEGWSNHEGLWAEAAEAPDANLS